MDKRIRKQDEHTGNLIYSPDFTNCYYHPVCMHIRKKNSLFGGTAIMESAKYHVLNEGQRQSLMAFDLHLQLV